MSDDDLIIGGKRVDDDPLDPLDAIELEKKIRPLFKGYHPSAQGSCLASLTALFIAGHMVQGDPKRTAQTREGLLAMHMGTVRAMIPDAERQIMETLKPEQAKRVN